MSNCGIFKFYWSIVKFMKNGKQVFWNARWFFMLVFIFHLIKLSFFYFNITCKHTSHHIYKTVSDALAVSPASFSYLAVVWTWWTHVAVWVLWSQLSSFFNRVWTGSAPSITWKNLESRTYWISLYGTQTDCDKQTHGSPTFLFIKSFLISPGYSIVALGPGPAPKEFCTGP